MAWINIRPSNPGGGRRPGTPTARLYDNGQLTLSHAAVALLGYPPRARVQVEPDAKRIRLTPSTPDDNGAFAVSGGGNTPSRVRIAEVPRRWPQLVGEYIAVRSAGSVELRQAEEE
jgi:hypothetical protein